MGPLEAERNNELDTISVLVVDDEPQTLSVLGRVLVQCGYEASCAESGLEALKALGTRRFDVMLCDVVMPDMNGLDLLRKTQELHKDTLVIMMSGYADMATAREALDLGANDFLVKPFSLLAVPIAIERNLRRRQIEANRVIEQRNKVLLESIKALSAAIDAKEHHTIEHSERIATMSLLIADALGLSSSDRSTLELAAYMHDVGKIGVSEAILLKPDKLDNSEWEEIKTHPDTGSQIISNIEELADLAEIIRHHHERVDGSGYPDGLSGERIPLLSRILAVADAFDAMTSDRPYRRRLTQYEAIARLEEGSGTQFDSRIVETLLNCIKEWDRKAA